MFLKYIHFIKIISNTNMKVSLKRAIHKKKIIIMQYIGLDLVSRTILKRNVDFQTADKTSFQSVSVFNK